MARFCVWLGILALSLHCWTSLASAQMDASTEWSILPSAVRACVNQELIKRGTSIPNLMGRAVRPSSSPFKELVDQCTPRDSAGRDPVVGDFVDWFSGEILSKPLFAKAFNQCREIVSLYQDQLLKRLAAEDAAATSNADQRRIRTAINDLSEKKKLAATVACTKEFIASLGITGASGYYSDELSLLEGRLHDSSFDLKAVAAAKVGDLTERGLMLLAAKTGLEHLQASELQVDQHGLGSAYLGCLLPSEWTGASQTGHSQCHGIVVERKVAEMAALLKLP